MNFQKLLNSLMDLYNYTIMNKLIMIQVILVYVQFLDKMRISIKLINTQSIIENNKVQCILFMDQEGDL
jgi:hypothetical protein